LKGGGFLDALAEAGFDALIWLIDMSLPSMPAQEAAARDEMPLPQYEDSAARAEKLRALSKKHLLMIIRDLKKELQQEKQEKEYLLLAHQAMLRHRK